MTLEAGDLVWADFDPIRGTEQAGRRPAMIISGRSYNDVSRRALVCPVTSNTRPWPFKVILPQDMKTKGAVLVDQLRAVDRSARILNWIEHAPDHLLDEVRGQLGALLGITFGTRES